ncbi:NOL8 protein, partial [Polyodon spathula]|nr:NOL8 protein [Polyodon spathula]
MKAAVPGTEVPDHKDWVVSKFGRVLPVLRLKTQGNNKVVKCDPSKHCHNIKKLDQSVDSESVTPVSKLTWQVAGGDDEISKKRRGEFPAYKVHPKKKRCSPSNGAKGFEDSDVEIVGRARVYKHFEDQDIKRGRPSELNCYISSRNSVSRGNEQPSTSQTAAAVQQREKPVCLFDDLDSEDEIRMMVAQENRKNKETMNSNVEEFSDLEVVGDEFSLKYGTHWAHQKVKGGSSKKMSEQKQSLKDLVADHREYDSADTDEILTFNNKTESSLKKPQKDPEMVRSEGQNGCDVGPSTKIPTIKVKTECGKNGKSVSLNIVRESGGDDDSNDSESCVDSDYEAMMQNCYRLELSLADLEQLAKKSAETSEEDGGESSSELKAPQHVLKVEKSQVLQHAKNTPEAILAAILNDSGDDYDGGKRKKKKTAAILPAFKGTKTISEPENREEKTNSVPQQKRKQEPSKDKAVKKQKTSIVQEQKASSSSSSESSSSEEEEMPVSKPPPFKGLKSPVEPASQNLCQEKKPDSESGSGSSSSNSSSDSEEGSSDEENEAQGKTTQKIERTKTAPAKNSQSLENKDASKKAWESKKPQGVLSSQPEIVRKHQQDNEKRLAALQQRQSEAKEQKKLIQGALSKLDTPETSTSRHIVFDSEEESDGESRQPKESCIEMKKSLFEESEESSDEDLGIPDKAKEFKNKAAGKLFESEDEEDAHSEDGERFQIKPQYEGKAGKKLMELQSRFGRDERFRMDSRFLESDNEDCDATEEIMKPNTAEEEELAKEKKKNLEILQNLLHINVQTAEPSKETAKKKTFRDVTALHYDPTREEHAAFETKIEEPKKESKAERRRNREEAEKLPEVSKEIYYDVAVDFKEVFSSTKTKVDDKAEIAWDQKVDEVSDLDTAAESQAALNLSDTAAENEQSAGFKFSFFGDDPVDEIHEKEDLYKIELLKSSKITWQEDQRFQDSSSGEEEEEDEQESGEKTRITTADNESLPGKKMNFFFFLKDDERLNEGPKMFCRSINLDEERERWEDNRSLLIEEYRKRHKDARRKFKAKQRN